MPTSARLTGRHNTKPRMTKLLAAGIVLALAAVACGSSDDTGGSSSGTTQAPLASATLNGSGATFPKAFYEEAIQAFKSVQPAITVNYAGGGSGKGRQELQDGVVDYAGSDGLVKAEDVPKYKGEFLYVPTVAAPITLSYNLTSVPTLALDATTIAKIFQRQIKQWDDPAIKALNPDATLPSTAITVAHRSDGSGTTENFTKYLVAAAGDAWALKSGSTVEWPADTQAGNGNQGVAQIVKSTDGAIGYVDLADSKATGLQTAAVKNKDGKTVKPTVAGATAALQNVTVNPDGTYNPLDAAGADSYPITAPTWILVYKNQNDKAKGAAVKSFLTYVVTDAQDAAADIDFAKLPSNLQDKAKAQIALIAVPA
jgi:phosphate transport system substrate-binding protein